MSAAVAMCRTSSSLLLDHLLRRIAGTPALEEPFCHLYLEQVFPPDVYKQLLAQFPDHDLYTAANERYFDTGADKYVRWVFALTPAKLASLPADQQVLWSGVAAALTAPDLKRAIYAKLAKDLAFRYGVSKSEVAQLPGYSRPTLYRETAGFEISPHPDTRRKVVTMQLYLPADRSQLNLGTALYRRKLLAWPLGSWHYRFAKVKQFPFQPNSAYAFVVNNTLTKKSWHGREKLPDGVGMRNTLLNTFYESSRAEFGGYLY
jgi:hypothetical protein